MNLLSMLTCLILLTLLSSCLPIYMYEPSEAEIQVGKIISRSEKIIYKKYGMKAAGTGIGMPSGVVHKIGLAFSTRDILTRDELRKVLIVCAQIMLNEFSSNDEIQPFLIKRPATLDNVQIILYNNDRDGGNRYDPEIATAQISGGILSFRTLDANNPHGTYKNDYNETYEEALKILEQQK